ncbi:MAG TPA: hypothetical protein VD867_16595 [Burkholderiales bacterium]|nr:hypothetical protein [Burkholderiales bacterium]
MPRALLLTAVVAAIVGHAHAGEARAVLSVTANVVETAGIGSSYQAQEFVISPRDVERGYVEVASASRFEFRNRGSSLLEFRSVSNVFRSVRVTGAAGTAEFGAAGGTLLQKPLQHGAGSVALSYRFELAPGVSPGQHRWPLSLTVLPL